MSQKSQPPINLPPFNSSDNESHIKVSTDVIKFYSEGEFIARIPHVVELDIEIHVDYRSPELKKEEEGVKGYLTRCTFLLRSSEIFLDKYCHEIVTRKIDAMEIPFPLDYRNMEFIIGDADDDHPLRRGPVENWSDMVTQIAEYILPQAEDSTPVICLAFDLYIKKTVILPHEKFIALKESWRRTRIDEIWRQHYEKLIYGEPMRKLRRHIAVKESSKEEIFFLDDDDDDDGSSCPICIESLVVGSKVTRTHCGHVYHQHCLLSWVEYSSGLECPYCRSYLCLEFERQQYLIYPARCYF